ncbi:phage protein NinX family protein [Proteus faecis]|uniref:phage protein NinX family protein n=1 Tax=Proteus faecis TaxID=2050967 RepID=UPI003075BB0B
MNKYTELSDVEINKRVFVASKIEHEDTYLHNNKVFYGDGARWIEFNPCNNPADAMPIIIENKISLLAGDGNFWCARYGEWTLLPYPSGIEFIEKSQVINDSPYRAAMELFLMMRDTENEKI